MPRHAERRRLPYSPEQIFDLVAAIERYPEFLPWCRAARILRRDGDILEADLVIGFKMFRVRFTSHVALTPSESIEVTYLRGPFKRLSNRWHFEPADDGACVIDFYVDFEFRSGLLQKAMTPLFAEAVRRMVASFEARAGALYGPRHDAPSTAPQAIEA